MNTRIREMIVNQCVVALRNVGYNATERSIFIDPPQRAFFRGYLSSYKKEAPFVETKDEIQGLLFQLDDSKSQLSFSSMA